MLTAGKSQSPVAKPEALAALLRRHSPRSTSDSLFELHRHVNLLTNTLSAAQDHRGNGYGRNDIVKNAVKAGLRIAFSDQAERAVNTELKAGNTATLLLEDPALAMDVMVAFTDRRLTIKRLKCQQVEGGQEAIARVQIEYMEAMDKILEYYARVAGAEKPRIPIPGLEAEKAAPAAPAGSGIKS